MAQRNSGTIDPAPTDEEAAAIVAALTAHLAASRATASVTTPRPGVWALAGRLASQGRPISHQPGVRPTWANIARLERMRRE